MTVIEARIRNGLINQKFDNMIKVIDLLERKHTLEKLENLCGIELSAEIQELKSKEYTKIMGELDKLNN
jgi:hypothetical protein